MEVTEGIVGELMKIWHQAGFMLKEEEKQYSVEGLQIELNKLDSGKFPLLEMGDVAEFYDSILSSVD